MPSDIFMNITLCILSVLAQRGYFKETYFVNYLKYLLYWKRPEYARYAIIIVVVLPFIVN